MVAMMFWACSKQSHKDRRGGRSLADRSKEAGGRHTHRRGGRMDARWSAIGRPVKNTYYCEHYVSIWATLLPSLYHHCASFGRPIASIERSQWRPLCLHSATTATLQPPWQWCCLLCATCCATTTALVVQGRHKGRGAAVHRNRTFWVWATTERPDHFSGRSKVAGRSQPCVKGALVIDIIVADIWRNPLQLTSRVLNCPVWWDVLIMKTPRHDKAFYITRWPERFPSQRSINVSLNVFFVISLSMLLNK